MKYKLKDINEETANMLADFFVLNNKKFPHTILLDGEVGAGKTFFSREYITGGNQDISFSSPTYTLVNEYDLGNRIVNHFDLYRITTDDYDWIYEYFEKEDEYFLFEWASLHQELFEDYETLQIWITYNDLSTRNYLITLPEKYENYLEEFFYEKNIVFEKCIDASNC